MSKIVASELKEVVTEEIIYAEEWDSLDAFLAEVGQVFGPDTEKLSGKIHVSLEGGYDESGCLRFTYTRMETPAERDKRDAESLARITYDAQERKLHELATLAALKAKYE